MLFTYNNYCYRRYKHSIIFCLFNSFMIIAVVVGQDSQENHLNNSPSEVILNGSNINQSEIKEYQYVIEGKNMSTKSHHFIIGVISDNDEKSKSKTTPNTWESKFISGTLDWNEETRKLSVKFDIANTKIFKSNFNSGGRGMELSELIYFDNVLTAMDDKTGIIFKILKGHIFPWVILASGDGKINKGFKSEWATVKDDKLYVGSQGVTISKGDERKRSETKWIKIISKDGGVQHINWSNYYNKLQNYTKCAGYLVHESVCWSDMQKKWYFLPRKCSIEPYDGKKTYDLKSSNILISTDEYFDNFQQTIVGKLTQAQGFSSFKFLPGSNDTIIVALKTTEVDSDYKTHISAFDLDGNILLDDTLISETDKFEGIEFIHEDDLILQVQHGSSSEKNGSAAQVINFSHKDKQPFPVYIFIFLFLLSKRG